MSKPSNSAAWLKTKDTNPLEVGPAPYTPPGDDQIVVKGHAVAINPVDWAKQSLGNLLMSHVRYPFIQGGDVAGEVIEVGNSVTRFHTGDRVIGLAAGLTPGSSGAAEGAFQNYTVLREHLATPIPSWMSFEDATVIPLTLGTAAYGLFHKDFLALDLPTVPARPITSASKVVIVTGGASSVGANAIQLATSAGYQVYTTCSPKNFAFVKKLGAVAVFDYHSATIAQDMIEALQDKSIAGALTVGEGAVEMCMQILSQVKDSNKFVAFAGFVPSSLGGSLLQTVALVGNMGFLVAKMSVLSYTTGVKAKFIDTKDVLEPDNVIGHVMRDFLPQALSTKQMVPAPPALVVGKGLDKIQDAMNAQKQGVSAQKVVVSL